MRIFFCIPTLDDGGAERQLCYLSAGLTRLGHAVSVAFLSDGESGSRLRASGVELHALGPRATFDARLIRELANIIRCTKADIVQTWLRRMDVAGGLAALWTGTPLIYSERSLWQSGGWRQRLRRSIVARARAVVANSDHAARVWQSMLPARTAVHVIPNALPLDELAAAPRAARSTLGVADDAELIAFVGRFVPAKGITLLSQSLSSLLRARPRAQVIVCGEGPLLPAFAGAIARAGLTSRCHLVGYRADVWSILKSADALISTSHYEGRPNAVLEAMACGCPVVLSDIPAHRELAGDDSAWFFQPFAEAAMLALSSSLDDRAAAAQRAERSQARVSRFTVAAAAAQYAAVYASVCGHVAEPRRRIAFS